MSPSWPYNGFEYRGHGDSAFCWFGFCHDDGLKTVCNNKLEWISSTGIRECPENLFI